MAAPVRRPRYTCTTCGLGVLVVGDQVIRGCFHLDAPVAGEMEATVYARGGLSNGPPLPDRVDEHG